MAKYGILNSSRNNRKIASYTLIYLEEYAILAYSFLCLFFYIKFFWQKNDFCNTINKLNFYAKLLLYNTSEDMKQDAEIELTKNNNLKYDYKINMYT